tara:strand:- start:257 stop:688 length:432 start_codon:yes stop_codon:yes gene_type:complete
MKKILFVCTANIFRSRFAEEVFNSLAREEDSSLSAFSAGLKVGEFTTRKIYYPALEQLERFNIEPLRENEVSTHIDDLDLDEYDRIICMDKPEHKPMVDDNPNLKGRDIEYWNIVDIPDQDSRVSLPICYEKVNKLFSEIIRG